MCAVGRVGGWVDREGAGRFACYRAGCRSPPQLALQCTMVFAERFPENENPYHGVLQHAAICAASADIQCFCQGDGSRGRRCKSNQHIYVYRAKIHSPLSPPLVTLTQLFLLILCWCVRPLRAAHAAPQPGARVSASAARVAQRAQRASGAAPRSPCTPAPHAALAQAGRTERTYPKLHLVPACLSAVPPSATLSSTAQPSYPSPTRATAPRCHPFELHPSCITTLPRPQPM